MFVTLKLFLDQHVTAGNAALHASNFGDSASGFDFTGGSNPAGENAFAVYRFLASASASRTTDFYILIQWADTSSFGSAPGNLGTLDSATADGVGLVMAFRTDGGDPWTGTTNADGTDTKGATPGTGDVWAGTGVTVLDRAGAGANNENTRRVFADHTAVSRVHMVGDADTVVIWSDSGDDNTVNYLTVFGAYLPLSGIAAPNPYFMLNLQNFSSYPATTSLFGSSGSYNGGLVGLDDSAGTQAFSVSDTPLGFKLSAEQSTRRYWA
jgi:hypothetical protein